MRRGLLGALLLCGCIDFDRDLGNFCTVHPAACDGGLAGNGGGAGGSGGGGGGGGAMDAGCGVFGSTCSGNGQCCPTTTVSAASYSMACSRIDRCQIASSDCLEEAFHCSNDDQCCAGKCTAGKCASCGASGDPCSAARNCCSGYLCGSNGQCVDSDVGAGSNDGRCTSSPVCAGGFCDLPDASFPEGTCRDPSDAGCVGLRSPPGLGTCCPGLQTGATCCLPQSAWCYYSSDCCSGNCTGNRCTAAATVAIGEHCENSNDCASSDQYCDPATRVCTDRWCYGSIGTPYVGCCVIRGSICTFEDAGACILPFFHSTTDAKCCSGARDTAGDCVAVQIFDP
jgi:hypothetical protein